MTDEQEVRELTPVEEGESGFIGYDDEGNEQYRLDNGEVTTNRSEYIRQEFEKDRGRSDIAEELQISYNIVYGATANMTNESTRESRMVLMEDGTPRKDYIREQIEEGRTRSDIADELGVSYNIVYAASKDMDAAGSRGRQAVIEGELAEKLGVEDGTPRTDYIRAEYEKGKTRREIADEVGVDYSVAWRATRDMKDPNAEDEETNENAQHEDAEQYEDSDAEDNDEHVFGVTEE